MNWNPDFEQAVHDDETTKARGTSCYFVQLSETTGLKLYPTKVERDASWVCQSVGAEYDIAPYTGECVDLVGLNIPAGDAPYWWACEHKENTPETLYGFLTEIVEVDENAYDDESSYSLKKRLGELGFDNAGDLNGPNVGSTSDGTTVVVDWDARFTVYNLLTPDELDEVESMYESGSLWHRAGC